MARGIEQADAWGLRAERACERAGEPPSRRRRGIGGISPVGLPALLALLLFAAGLAVVSPSAAGAAAPGIGRGVVARSAPVQVTSGPGALYGSLAVVGASAEGILVSPTVRGGNGGPINSTTQQYSVLAAGSHTLVQLHPTLVSPTAYIGSAALSGPFVGVYEVGSTGAAVWWYDISNRKSGLYHIKSTETFQTMYIGGLLVEESGSSHDAIVELPLPSGASKVLATYPTADSVAVKSGPTGAVLDLESSRTSLAYVAYGTPRHLVRLYSATGVGIYCGSMTTTAVGCTLFKGSSSYATRFELTGLHPLVRKVGTTYPSPTVVVTPKVTAYYECTPTGCPLHRIPVSGTALKTYRLPVVANVASDGDDFYYSPTDASSSAGGLFALLDTANVSSHLVSGVRSPLAAAEIAIGTNSIAWIDNGHAGLGVWTRSYRVSSTGVSLGKPKLLGTGGLVDSDATDYSLNVADSGGVVAATTYAHQPTADPVDITAYDGGHTTLLSDLGEDSLFSTPIMDVSLGDVLFQTSDGFDLSDVATKQVTVLPMTDIASYAAGGGKIAFVKTDGSVWVETNARTGATQIAPPLPGGESLSYLDSLSVSSDGNWVAWAEGWYSDTSSGQETQYLDVKTGGTPVDIPSRTGLVSTLSITPSVLGVGYAQTSGSSQLWATALPTGTWKEYAPVTYGLSIGGKVAGWVGANGLPYIERI